jgi:hypothetical protein
MVYSINLAQAAQALQAHFGSRFAAGRLGGRQRLAVVLREQFDITEPDADMVLAALDRRQAIRWVAEPGLPLPCPGVVELCGDWVIQPDHVRD